MGNPVKRLWQFITSPDYSRTVSILALLVVILAIPLTVFIAQKQQEIRQRAAERCDFSAYSDQSWVQQYNTQFNQFTQNPSSIPKANDDKTIFTTDAASCDDIRNFYATYGSNAPQQWVNERNAQIGAPAPTATPPSSTTVHQEFEPCPSNTACNVTSPNIIDRSDRSKDLYCRKIGSSTNEEFEWITQQYANAQCSSTQIGRTAICGGTTYYCDGRPGGWTTTRPSVPTAAPTAVPTLTSVPTLGPILTTFCGVECRSFVPNSTDPNNCSAEQYVVKNSYDNQNPTGKGLCSFSCLALSPGYERNGQTSCGQKPISIPTQPPFMGGPGPEPGTGPGGPNPTAGPGPGPTAVPTQPPSLTKLIFDLIFPEGKKDKALVVQVFNTTAPDQLGEDLKGTITRSTGGNFTGTINVPSTIATGSATYNIKIKADKYLRKLIRDVQITKDTTNRVAQTTLTPGDINGDNKINIADYNILIDCFGDKANSQTCGNNKDLADLDDNGRIDGVDYNLFLISLSKGPRDGD